MSECIPTAWLYAKCEKHNKGCTLECAVEDAVGRVRLLLELLSQHAPGEVCGATPAASVRVHLQCEAHRRFNTTEYVANRAGIDEACEEFDEHCEDEEERQA